MPDASTQRDHYNQVADRYDEADNFGIHRQNRTHMKKLRLIRDALRLTDGMRVLEVGCGTGIHAERIQDWPVDVDYIGLDVSRGMLQEADSRLDGQPLVEADAQALPLADRSVDAVIGTAVLHHIEDQPAAYREFHRVLRPTGKLVLLEPNILFPKDLLLSALQPEERHKYTMRPRRQQRHAAAAGFAWASVDHRIYTPPWPARLHDLYDRVDGVCRRLPVVRQFSMMLRISGRALHTTEDGC